MIILVVLIRRNCGDRLVIWNNSDAPEVIPAARVRTVMADSLEGVTGAVATAPLGAEGVGSPGLRENRRIMHDVGHLRSSPQ